MSEADALERPRFEADARRQAMARVRACLAIARRIADPDDAMGREVRARLPEVTGLSPESVELALREHLETEASETDLETFVARARDADRDAPDEVARCLVVLSANVCTAAARAIAFACAAAPRVMVKASRRDPVLAEVLVRGLGEEAVFRAAGGAIELVDDAAIDGLVAPAEVHVYASDETLQVLRGRVPPGVRLRAHGTGFGVAAIEADADLRRAAEQLARDVIAFDQRGCLSPRAALVASEDATASPSAPSDRASTFARALAAALADLQRAVPRGSLDAGARAAVRVYTSTVSALGELFEGDGFVVGLDEAPIALLLPPEVRAVHVVPATPASVEPLLGPLAPKIAAIGVSGPGPLGDALRAVAPGARVSPLGAMQRPRMDGPVDLRDDR